MRSHDEDPQPIRLVKRDEGHLPSLDDIQSQLEDMEAQWHETSIADPEDQEIDRTAAHTKSKELKATAEPGAKSLVLSTLLSLLVVLVLLGAVRLMLPQMLEWCRYSWTRGQLRAEYEFAGQQLRQVSLDGLSQVSQLVGQRVSPSVVHINMRQSDRSNPSSLLSTPFSGFDGLRIDQGSGVVIDDQGHILTNNHVVESGGEIEVFLSDGRLVKAEIVGIDEKTDLAILHVESNELMPITWGDSDKVHIGMPVWAVGSPFGLTGSVTFGILSGKHRIDLSSTRLQENVTSKAEYSDLMQSDVAVNPGNSGGPLVNAQGELIGINTAIIGDSYRGVSFSIPSNVVRRVCDKILSTGRIERGVLGIIMDVTYNPKRDGNGPNGVLIEDFIADTISPAEKAGIEIGDVVVRVDGKPVDDLRDLKRLVGEAYVGSNVDVVVIRDDEELTFSVRIAPTPEFGKP